MLRAYTIPGIWNNQPASQFIRLSQMLPFIEWGLGYRSDNESGALGFPSTAWLEQLVQQLDALNPQQRENVRLALHINGTIATNFLGGYMVPRFGLPESLWRYIRRVQVPLAKLLTDDEDLAIDIPEMRDNIQSSEYQDHPQGYRCTIFQVDSPASDAIVYQICQMIRDAYPLFDFESIQGLPDTWPPASFPNTQEGERRAHGYAANFTRDNIKSNIEAIQIAANEGPFWLQGGKQFLVGEEFAFGRIKEAIEILNPLYRAGCCRQVGSPVRIQFVRLNEREW